MIKPSARFYKCIPYSLGFINGTQNFSISWGLGKGDHNKIKVDRVLFFVHDTLPRYDKVISEYAWIYSIKKKRKKAELARVSFLV